MNTKTDGGSVPVAGLVQQPVRPLSARLDVLRVLLATNYPEHHAAVAEAQAEIERLRADLKAMEGFADLWYFVSDEAPMEFGKIVAEYSPGRWMTEAHKLRAAKRGA